MCLSGFVRTIDKGLVLQLLLPLLTHDSRSSVQRLENVIALTRDESCTYQRWDMCIVPGGFAHRYLHSVRSIDFYRFHGIFLDCKLTFGQFCRGLMDTGPAFPRLRQK